MHPAYCNPSTNLYEKLLQDPCEIAEKKFPYNFLTERHVQVIWFEQKYFKNLTTSEGLPIEVLSPGLWNMEAGPDFRKAHLKIGSEELKGDIEIHLSDEGWMQHLHHLDSRYNDVILHLSLWKPSKPNTIETLSGKSILRAYLEPKFTIPQTRILNLIDLDLYPYKQFVGSGRCAHKLFRSLPEEKILHFFHSAADWRLMRKLSYLKSRTEAPELLFGAGIAMALGYKHNAEAFFELFIILQKYRYRSEQELLVLGMGICGFFTENFSKKWSYSPFYRELKECFDRLDIKIYPSIPLVLSNIRPLNHPIRRLVYLIKLLSDNSLSTFSERLFNHWDTAWSFFYIGKKWGKLRQQMQDMLPIYQDAYWNSHYLFEEFSREEFLSLMGEDLKTEIMINTFLPLLHEKVLTRMDDKEIQAFRHFYAAFPAGRTGKSEYLTHRFFGDTSKGSLLNKAYSEQGAYQLHRDFCVHYEGSCEGCPFVDRYTEFFK